MDNSRKRLLLYLLLNVVVSACTTTLVLFLYDRYVRNPALPEPVSTSAAVDSAASVEIITVIGAGLPSSELVQFRNTGAAEANLNGWKLQDAQGNIYTFKAVTLLPGGAIQLHTAPGADTLIDLYWGLTAPVWSSGETATLLDPAGTVKSVYKVP